MKNELTWDDIPNEGDWEIRWVSEVIDGKPVYSTRRFRSQGEAELFKADHCGMTIQQIMMILQELDYARMS